MKQSQRAGVKPIERGGFSGGVWRLGRSLLLTWLFMLGLIVVIAPIALLNVRWFGLIAGVLIWLIGSGLMFSRAGDAFDGWGWLCSAVPMMLVAYGLPDYLAVRAATTVRVASVAEIAYHDAGQAFEFRQAQIQTQYHTTYTTITRSKSGGTTRRNYNVAPLTTANWQPDQPVLAWVGCTDSYSTTCDEWDEPYRVGVPVSEWDVDALRTATERAVEKHGLRVVDDAPIFTWSESAEAEAEKALTAIAFGSLFAYAMWAVPKIVVTMWHGLTAA
ncbi:MAG: hypothetical protein KA765_02795 [Thermoflexales bacterium]|nr:hypothetical protein [Thermoflexales bacterium]